MAQAQDIGVFASLPDITTELRAADRRKAASLLEELDESTALVKTHTERIEEIKGQLETIQTRNKLNGLRFCDWAFRALEVAGRRTLDKKLLMENGVDPETIEVSMKESAPSVRREFRHLDN